MSAPVRFYFDFNSTFSYIAIHRIDALAARTGRDVDWSVVSLAHLFQAIGSTPPPLIPAKARYLAIDFVRACAEAGLPCTIPDPFPPDVKLARRTFWHLKRQGAGAHVPFAKAVSTALFGKGEVVCSAEELAAACIDVDGVDRAVIAAAADDDLARDDLKAALDAALADGMIGAPFFVADGEPFWGADRLEALERLLTRG